MKNFQQNLKKLEATDTQVLGVSMDSTFSNAAFADKIGVDAASFPVEPMGRFVLHVRSSLRRDVGSPAY